MRKFFTSDLHLQSPEGAGIVEWAQRPFKSATKHDAAMIRGIRERVKPDDLLIHVGDFMNYGKNREFEGGRKKPEEFIKEIDRQIIFLEGNHDPNNRVQTIGRTLTTSIGPYVVSVSHYPREHKDFEMVTVPAYKDSQGRAWKIHLCGHVHGAWRYKFGYGYLCVNVGVDAWKYRPVSEAELVNYIQKILIGKK